MRLKKCSAIKRNGCPFKNQYIKCFFIRLLTNVIKCKTLYIDTFGLNECYDKNNIKGVIRKKYLKIK